MNAAVVERYGESPRYGSFAEPDARAGEVLVEVRAAALSNLTRGQAGGRHYSSGTELPLVPGSDGVGISADGKRVYFFGPRAPFGAMAERTVVALTRIVAVPEGVDDVTAAALGNPALGSWGALVGRAKLQRGETVLVNGATGVTGRQAVQAAKVLGAKRVIATGRNAESLDGLRELGADEVIALDQSEDLLLAVCRRELHEIRVNVVLDYLWGASAKLLLRAAGGAGSWEGEPRVRFVQIGSTSAAEIELPGGLLRSSGVELLGSGLGSLSAAEIVEALGAMFAAAEAGALTIATRAVPLPAVERAWSEAEDGRRVVFMVGADRTR